MDGNPTTSQKRYLVRDTNEYEEYIDENGKLWHRYTTRLDGYPSVGRNATESRWKLQALFRTTENGEPVSWQHLFHHVMKLLP